MRDYYQLIDLLLPPLYLILLLVWAKWYESTKVEKHPEYRFFTLGLLAKTVGAIAVCLIYTFYYNGGDSTLYFDSTKPMWRLADQNFTAFLEVMFRSPGPEVFSYFNTETDWPAYRHDHHSFFVVKIVTVFAFLGGHSFITTAILLAAASFSGIWKLFRFFYSYYPSISDQLAIAVLYIPSVVFWGSGILKDTLMIGAIGWYTYTFHEVFIRRRIRFFNTFMLLFSSYLMLAIKPYIFFAVLPGSTIWYVGNISAYIENRSLRMMVTPMLVIIGLALGYLILDSMQEQLGQYRFDNILKKAVVSQRDQQSEHYQGNSFNIGEFDDNIPSILGVSHKAVFAGMFRPTLLDVKNVVMLLAALENTYLLLLTILLLIKLRVGRFFKYIFQDPLLLFSVLFALFFAFSVGLATSNFGSLVRLRIPSIPFYLSALFVLRMYYEKYSGKKLGI
ncbi:MAG: hypothetical protein IT233_05725 [Bacteroidia bacterium]|nr:hypothetical protein [Bacteroidia bacterium]